MFYIDEKDLDVLIHDLMRIATTLHETGQHCLDETHKKILKNCVTRLYEIREKVLQVCETKNFIRRIYDLVIFNCSRLFGRLCSFFKKQR